MFRVNPFIRQLRMPCRPTAAAAPAAAFRRFITTRVTPPILLPLTGRIALVTGGSGTIGAAIAHRLAASGAHVVVASRNHARCESIVQSLPVPTATAAAATTPTAMPLVPGSARHLAVPCDVTDRASIDKCIQSVESYYTRAFTDATQTSPLPLARRPYINILVNAHGIVRDSLLVRASDADVHDTLQVNTVGTILLCRAVVRHMLRHYTQQQTAQQRVAAAAVSPTSNDDGRYGRIITLGSVVASDGGAGQSVYAASKSALTGFTSTLSREVASRRITVNLLEVGWIAGSPMTESVSPDVRERAVTQQLTHGKRLPTAEDVAAAVAYLSTPESAHITGQTITINGDITPPFAAVAGVQ